MARKKKKPVPVWKKLLLAAIAAVALTAGAARIRSLPYYVGETVVEVVDGDTFILQNRQPIRLYGLDAPEPDHCFGPEARRALSYLIQGKRVIIREPLADQNGRILALVYVDNILVNEMMVRGGFALYRQGVTEREKLKPAHEHARSTKAGIYSPRCWQTKPPDPRCSIKGNFDYNRKVKVYFTPACNNYSNVIVKKHEGDNWFCTESESQHAGFIKAKDCIKDR